MGEENKAYYFKWTCKCYSRRGGVKSRLIEEGAYIKNHPT